MTIPQQAANKKLVIPCQVFSRIVGYLQPIDSWNIGKVEEFKDRLVYGVPGGEAEATDAENVNPKG